MSQNKYRGIDFDLYREQLKKHEGVRNEVYVDSEGYPTVGVGHKLTTRDGLSVGDRISDEKIDELLQEDAKSHIESTISVYEKANGPGSWDKLPEAQKHNVANLGFNLGPGGLSKFKGFLGAMGQGDYNSAAAELVDSKWHGQVGNRAYELEKAVASNTQVSTTGTVNRTDARVYESRIEKTQVPNKNKVYNDKTKYGESTYVSGKIYDKVEDNILGKYDLSTYHIRFSLVNKEILNTVLSNRHFEKFHLFKDIPVDYEKNQIIIAETGATSISIESLEIETTNAPNANTGAVTATKFNMRVVEPFGTTLIDRTYLASRALGIENQTKYPYMIEVSFRGRDPETGEIIDIKEAGLHRWFVVITKVDISVDVSGSIYDFELMNAGDIGVTAEFGKIDQNINVSSFNNLQQSFDTLSQAINETQKKNISPNRQYPDIYEIVAVGELPLASVGSGAVNFAEQKIVKDQLYKSFRMGETRDSVDFSINGQKFQGDKELAGDNITMQFNDKIAIYDIIKSIVSSTEWAEKQLTVAMEEGKNDGNPQTIFKTLFKVTAYVEFLNYDYLRNDYQKRFVYVVKPYVTTVVNDRVSELSISSADRAKTIRQNGLLKKEYNYLYTGKNTDVINFDMRFNYAWYASMPVGGGKYLQTSKVNAGEKISGEDASKVLRDFINDYNTVRLHQMRANPAVLDNLDTLKKELESSENTLNKMYDTMLQAVNTDPNVKKVFEASGSMNKLALYRFMTDPGIRNVFDTTPVPFNPKDCQKALCAYTETDFAFLKKQAATNVALKSLQIRNQMEFADEMKKSAKQKNYLEDMQLSIDRMKDIVVPISWKEERDEVASKDGVEHSGKAYFNSLFSQMVSMKLAKIDLQIIGDPFWLSNELDPEDEGNPRDIISYYFYFKVITPVVPGSILEQAASLKSAPAIEGFYTPIKVTHKFESGKFTQVLHCTKDILAAVEEEAAAGRNQANADQDKIKDQVAMDFNNKKTNATVR